MRQVIYYQNPQQIIQQPYQQNVIYQPMYSPIQQKYYSTKQDLREAKNRFKQVVKHPITFYQQRQYHKQLQQQQKYIPRQNTKKIYFQPQRQNINYLGRQKQLQKHQRGRQRQQQYQRKKQKGVSILNKIMPLKLTLQQIPADQFQFKPLIKYKIVPSQSPKMTLDVTTLNEDKQLIKGNIIIWSYHGGPNQVFYIQRISSQGLYNIISCATGYLLQVGDASHSDGAKLIMSPRVHSDSQRFRFQSHGSHLFKIRTFCNKYLDVQHNWIRNGQPVIQYTLNQGKNQLWKVVPS